MLFILCSLLFMISLLNRISVRNVRWLFLPSLPRWVSVLLRLQLGGCISRGNPRCQLHPFGVMQILSISIPATFIGVIMAGLWSLNRGKDLIKTNCLYKIADPEQKEYIYGDLADQSLANKVTCHGLQGCCSSFPYGYRRNATFGSFRQLKRLNLPMLKAL